MLQILIISFCNPDVDSLSVVVDAVPVLTPRNAAIWLRH